MADRMFGFETEYSASAFGVRGGRVSPESLLCGLLDVARSTLPHLPEGCTAGIFLANGSRLYPDCGNHLELAGPELLNPWDWCRYLSAGDRIVLGLARELSMRRPSVHDVFLTRCNFSYSTRVASTWGAHESYGHRADPAMLSEQLIPHLVSRILYTGAGGFNNRSGGFQFMISPRVAHLVHKISNSSTSQRGIYHTKEESLSAKGYRRAHLLCGESNCSHKSNWLKSGVTAALVALIEARLNPCREVCLRDPLIAMHRFSLDFEGTATAEGADGRPWTALAIQRHILGQIEAHADDPIMPPWTPELCRQLRDVLDALEQDRGRAARMVDWAIKLAYYPGFAARQGVAWERLCAWHDVLAGLDKLVRLSTEAGAPAFSIAQLLAAAGPLDAEVTAVKSLAQQRGLDWDQLPQVLAVRARLFELDTRFAQLGDDGIFNLLDRSGALDHAVPGVDNIEHAMCHPPAAGRARIRGEAVARFYREGGNRYQCDWSGVRDSQQNRYLDLADPFASSEIWKDYPSVQDPHLAELEAMLREMRIPRSVPF